MAPVKKKKRVTKKTATKKKSSFSSSAVGGYHATQSTVRRPTPQSKLISEDDQLKARERKRLIWSARNVKRNFAVASWAIRKHLDFVANHTFACKTQDDDLNNLVESLMKGWSKKNACDVAGRHPLSRFVRLAESCRTVDGDCFIMKLRGGQIQAIEGDRVRDPDKLENGQVWSHGVLKNGQGKAKAYAIHKRTSSGFEFERTVRANRAIQFGYFDRFDQVRGISPLAAAINPLQDVYESTEYALAKMKVAQLFGLVLKREMGAELDDPTETDSDGDEVDDTGAGSKTAYDIDFGSGPVMLDLDPGDEAEFLENKTPSTEFDRFLHHTISMALKAIDIPYSFYDEAYTNFFGSRSALILYLKSCESKRAAVQELLGEITDWKINQWKSEGILPNVDIPFRWTPSGVAWWNPVQEVKGAVMRIAAGLDTRTNVVLETTGRDYADVLDELAKEQQMIEAKGVTITEAPPEIFMPEPVVNNDDD